MSGIDFYFSIGSTYTYLSVTRILDVEKKHQVKFNWKPFSVRAIMKEMNNIPFPKDKMNKVNYMWRDIERRAEGYGFFAKTPVPYPLSEFDLANQIAILGLEKGWGEKFVISTYKKWFQQGKEPAIEPSISEVCEELNLNKDEIISGVKSSDIENKYSEKIFKMFERLHTDESYKGTGIGLASVKRMVEKHGGSIHAEGIKDKGATFYITFPNK